MVMANKAEEFLAEVIKTGQSIRQMRGDKVGKQILLQSIQLKDNNTPFSKADGIAHQQISKALEKLDSTIAIVSEESSDKLFHEVSSNKPALFWSVDPLDGTRNYLMGGKSYCICIALICSNQPCLAVIYAPEFDELYLAKNSLLQKAPKINEIFRQLNQASYIYTRASQLNLANLSETSQNNQKANCQKLQINATQNKNNADQSQANNPKIIASPTDSSPKLKKLLSYYDNYSFVKSASALKFCLIARNLADIYPRYQPCYEWDCAAGDLIVTQAGGTVVDTNNRKLKYQGSNKIMQNFIATTNTKYIKAFSKSYK